MTICRYPVVLTLPVLITLVTVPATASILHEDEQSLQAVEEVLRQYKSALEALDASETSMLFTEDSRIYETGNYEGDYATYLSHHLAPELEHFEAFRFSDYTVEVRFEGPVAIASERYNYTIEIEGRDPIERQGVATSVLRHVDDEWRIVQMHNSGRPIRRPEE
ncbi:MAG: nuclear transport factor 2 family protein [Parasphingopyxis sp.]|uniref:nuclear transport factor 2 family protein n=1 Tax=Parasphingopyxis sp. TaxID=1920299 RepID=UPI0032EDFCE6